MQISVYRALVVGERRSLGVAKKCVKQTLNEATAFCMFEAAKKARCGANRSAVLETLLAQQAGVRDARARGLCSYIHM